MNFRLYIIEKDTNYLIVSGISLSIFFWTLATMHYPINSVLCAIEDKNKVAEDAKIRKLISKWAQKQWVRTTLGVAAFVVAVMACKK